MFVGRADVFVSEPQRDDGGGDPGVQATAWPQCGVACGG